MREIAVRGFINEKFNTTFGKGLFRRAVYNGSVELHKPNQKYLVDYYSYSEWEAQAKSDGQIAAINHLANSGVTEDKEMLFSWLVHYDPLTKSKERVPYGWEPLLPRLERMDFFRQIHLLTMQFKSAQPLKCFYFRLR